MPFGGRRTLFYVVFLPRSGRNARDEYMQEDFYELLQVHPKADPETIELAYVRLRERYAPERLTGAADELIALAEQRRQLLERAYATLSNPKQRAAYDAAQARRAPAVDDDDDADEVLDYQPLPAAAGRERSNDVAARPLRQVARPPRGRKVAARRPGWFAPVVTIVVLVTLVAGTGLALTGGGAAPEPAAPTPTPSLAQQYDALLPQIRQAAEAQPTNAQGWINYGNTVYDSIVSIRELQGEQSPEYQTRVSLWPEAVSAYSKALEIEPSNWLVRADLGASLCYQGASSSDQGAVQRGLVEARRAQEQTPRDPRTLNSLAQCLVSLTPPQTAEALTHWQKIIEVDPASQFAVNARQQIARFQK
jgi:tetratricopeptide (TPR) repeat protein